SKSVSSTIRSPLTRRTPAAAIAEASCSIVGEDVANTGTGTGSFGFGKKLLWRYARVARVGSPPPTRVTVPVAPPLGFAPTSLVANRWSGPNVTIAAVV